MNNSKIIEDHEQILNCQRNLRGTAEERRGSRGNLRGTAEEHRGSRGRSQISLGANFINFQIRLKYRVILRVDAIPLQYQRPR